MDYEKQIEIIVDRNFNKVNKEGVGFLNTEITRCKNELKEIVKKLTIHSVGKCKLLGLQTKIKSDNIEIWNKIKNIKVFDYNTSKLKVKYRQNKELLEVIQKNL